jgi:hypothetical protein
MRKIEVLKCDYCTSISKSEEYLKRHERNCLANPINRSCITCIWYNVKDHVDPCLVDAIIVEESAKCYIKRFCDRWIWEKTLTYVNTYELFKLVSVEIPTLKFI